MPTTPPPRPHPRPPSQSSPSFHLPVRGRWGGGEGPPSLGSQPLNQALSHPVNLKQSGFNSSCLSVPALAGSVEAPSSEARRPRPMKTGWDAPEDSSAQADTSTPVLLAFYFWFSSANWDPWCQGNFWNSTLFRFTAHCGSDCAAHKLRGLDSNEDDGSFLGTFRSQLLQWSLKSQAFMQHRHWNTTTAGSNYHPGQIQGIFA